MPCPDISFKPPQIFKSHLLFTSNIVFFLSFVPESSLANHLGHLWSTNGHTQGMTSHTKLHEFWDHFGILWSLRKLGLPVLQYSIQWYNSKYPHAQNVHWKSLILWNPLQVGCFQHSPQVGSKDSPWQTWKIVDSPSFPARTDNCIGIFANLGVQQNNSRSKARKLAVDKTVTLITKKHSLF